jgi:hypothetical protein
MATKLKGLDVNMEFEIISLYGVGSSSKDKVRR